MSETTNILPAANFINITPSDTSLILSLNNRAILSRAILIGVAGDLALKDVSDNTVIISALAVGIMHPIETRQILSTGTTADDICVFY